MCRKEREWAGRSFPLVCNPAVVFCIPKTMWGVFPLGTLERKLSHTHLCLGRRTGAIDKPFL